MNEEGTVRTQAPWARRFFTLWGGQAFSLVGSALVQWALMFWLAVTTGSPVVLAVAGLMGLLPQLVLAPFAGAYVDRWDRKRVMLVADSLTAVSTFLLILVFSASVDLWIVFAVMFFRSAMQAFHWPAMQASTTLMVPPEHLARIGGINQALMGLSMILGPALGAVLYMAMPMNMVLSIDIVTAAVAVAALLAIKIPEVARPKAEAQSVLKDLTDSFRYLRSWKGALLVILIFSLVNLLFTPAMTLISLLTLQHFGQDAYGVALIDVMAGVGMIVGGIALGVWGGTRRKIVTCMAAIALAGVGTLVIGILPSNAFLVAVACALGVGATLAMVNGSVMAMLQKGVRADIQGRVFALVGSIAAAMSPLGLALSGPLAAVFGIQFWFVAGGALMIILGAATFFVPRIMMVEDHMVDAVAMEP
jgi:DHA3 family macrolide efflux protein-like MFS transporter